MSGESPRRSYSVLIEALPRTASSASLGDSVPAPSAVETTAAKNEKNNEDDQKCGAVHEGLLAKRAIAKGHEYAEKISCCPVKECTGR